MANKNGAVEPNAGNTVVSKVLEPGKTVPAGEVLQLVGDKSPAIEVVRRAVGSKLGKFTKTDIMELCSTLGKISVESSLKQLVDEGVLIKHGKGRATFYARS